jgi:hypothetical protein
VQVENGNNGLTPGEVGEVEVGPILSEDKHSTINFAAGVSSPDYDYRTSLHERSSREERSFHEDISSRDRGSLENMIGMCYFPG